MARSKNDSGGWEGLLAVIVVGGLILVAQDVVKDETESWLKRNGLWPR
jgi:hypothetical protein